MDSLNDDILRRAAGYAQVRERRLDRRLGFGKDGTVWDSDRSTAVKVFRTPEPFRREAAAYRRLTERSVLDVLGFRVPQLLNVDDRLMVIEMTIVRPPFVLDFGSAYLDGAAPRFPEDIMEEWLADKQEEFGDRWQQAASVIRAFERLGIQLTDIHPGNIAFQETPK